MENFIDRTKIRSTYNNKRKKVHIFIPNPLHIHNKAMSKKKKKNHITIYIKNKTIHPRLFYLYFPLWDRELKSLFRIN